MRVRFLQDYQGQYTGPHFYRAGQVAELGEAAASRLVADNRAEMVAPASAPEPTVDYATMKVAELRELASRRGIDFQGLRKAELIAALEA